MKKLVMVGALLLAACGFDDTYSFKQKEFDNNQVQVSFVDYESRSAFQAAAERYKAVETGRQTQAFSILTKKGKECEVHMFDPSKEYRPQWLGHEVYHCRYGRFHD